MTDFQIEKWQSIKSEEASRTTGVSLLYERYERFLKKLEKDSDEVIFIEIQQFKVRLAVQYVQTAYFAKAQLILEATLAQLTERTLVAKYPKLHNRILLGLLKCAVHFKEPILSERIAKRRIDRTFIEEPKYFKNLLWESNNLYWWRKPIPLWAAFIGLLLEYLEFILWLLGIDHSYHFWETGLALISSSWVHYIINKDYLCVTPLQIVVIDNFIRAWLNKTFDWKLGRQNDL